MKYFGTDGIRGIYGKTLTEELAYKVGLAASRFFGGEWFIATDTRPSGEALLSAVCLGLIQGGCDVKKVGVLPTPGISYLTYMHGGGGMVISASHNPPEFNGIKLFYNGYKLSPFSESGLEEYIDRPPARTGGGRAIPFYEGREEYVDWLVSSSERLDGKTVYLDCAYGSACAVAEEVFTRLSAHPVMFNDDGDGSKINCGVGALHPDFILSKAGESLGFAFDGDGDRLQVVNGHIIDGDSSLHNLALLCDAKGVVGTVLSNMALENALKNRGVAFIRTAVGDKNISEAMRRHRFSIGGEQSGHFIVSPCVSGDAVYAALRLCRVRELFDLELIPQVQASISSIEAVLIDKRFIKKKNECEKRIFGKGRLLVRMSGTEPKIRLMAECEDKALIQEIIDELSDTICLINKELL